MGVQTLVARSEADCIQGVCNTRSIFDVGLRIMHQDSSPISQKRVTVPVSSDVLDAFRSLASVSGVSVGKAMGDWLADTLDAVYFMTELLKKAKEAPKLAALEIQAYGRGITGIADDLMHDLRAKSGGSSEAQSGGAPLRGGVPSVASDDSQTAPPTLQSLLKEVRARGEGEGDGDAA